jgi:hypothetical protein
MYTNFTLFPCCFQDNDYFSLYKKYLTCYDFSTSKQWLAGTFSLASPYDSYAFIIGLYYLHSCFISGKFFLVIVRICFLRTIAAVKDKGF